MNETTEAMKNIGILSALNLAGDSKIFSTGHNPQQGMTSTGSTLSKEEQKERKKKNKAKRKSRKKNR